MGLKILASAAFGYFAFVSLMNAWLGYANRARALSTFEPGREHQGSVFLRLWIAINLISFFLLLVAAVFVWFRWSVALALGLVPVAFFAAANVISICKRPPERE